MLLNQGAATRASAEFVMQLSKWGLTGWVRNRRDGSVEALFCGPVDHVADMLERVQQGPPSARVTAVKILAEGDTAPVTFTVLPTA
jgi:acylphosphatase